MTESLRLLRALSQAGADHTNYEGCLDAAPWPDEAIPNDVECPACQTWREVRAYLAGHPADPDVLDAIEAGTHEPAVDDFDNQYLARLAPAAAEPADPRDGIIARLRQALKVQGHQPHDSDGPCDEASGFPTCSVCGAILTAPESADEALPPCVFPGCVSTDRHFHGSFPGGYEGGWLVLETPDMFDAHVVPAEQQGTDSEHEPSVLCWCLPASELDMTLKGRVYLHRRAHDHGHRYTDEER